MGPRRTMLSTAVAGLVASSGFTAPGLVPQAPVVRGADPLMMSRFTGWTWTLAAKQAILEEWDPEEKRGYDNFNPFERDDQGNACDTNGKFPGETAYKDPIRADTSFAQMQADRETMEEIKKDPKMSITGKPGNWKFGWDDGLGAVP